MRILGPATRRATPRSPWSRAITDYQSFILGDRHNIQQTFTLFYCLIAGPLSHTTVHHILWLGLPILFCLDVGTNTLHTNSRRSRISTSACLSRCLNVRGKYFSLTAAVMRLAVQRPSYKQAGLGCLREFGRLTTEAGSRHISERPWIISLSNTLVEAEPQLAPTGAWVWRTIVFTPLQQSLDWLAIKPNNEQALLGCSGELGRSAIGTKSNAVFIYRCNSQGLGAIRSHYKRALRGCSRELLRFKGVKKYTVTRFAVNR